MKAIEIRLTEPALKVLRLFSENLRQKRSGSEISKLTKVGAGTLYPLLDRLETAGWIVGEWEKINPSEAGRPRRRYYHLTGLGHRNATRALGELQFDRGFAWTPS